VIEATSHVSSDRRHGLRLRADDGGVCAAWCYSQVSREARPDAGMAEIRGFSAVMERVKGIDNKPSWLKARN